MPSLLVIESFLGSCVAMHVNSSVLSPCSSRKKDMVIRGGENISCAEVEAAV